MVECGNPGDDCHVWVKLNLCASQQRDFDVYAGKMEEAINQNVKFYCFL